VRGKEARLRSRSWAALLATAWALAGGIHAAPGHHPVARIFAPAASLQDATRFEQYSVFSPDGTEYYLSVADAEWNYRGIMRSVRRDGAWSPYAPLPFVWGERRDGGEPFVTADGRSLYFVSARAGERPDETAMAGSAAIVQSGETDIYVATRADSDWSDPVRLSPPVNSRSSEWHPTVADDGTLYFASERGRQDGKADIYVAAREADGSYRQVRRLPPPINLDGVNDSDPFIAPDGSYLIFHSDRPGGLGAHDLYVSFARPDGGWSEPVNMGPGINSPSWEMGPHVTRDGRTLLFTRRAAISTHEPSRIYAVDVAEIRAMQRQPVEN